jgi:NAD(P)-dependent dehydrogenase (short-subunit alcohol dehydrogenase family)
MLPSGRFAVTTLRCTATYAAAVGDAGSEALALMLDISDPASVEEARTRVETGLGQVDILVNNAATLEKRHLGRAGLRALAA